MSIFAKRHYEWLADFVRRDLSDLPETRHSVAHRLAHALVDEDSAFNHTKFLAKCLEKDYNPPSTQPAARASKGE